MENLLSAKYRRLAGFFLIISLVLSLFFLHQMLRLRVDDDSVLAHARREAKRLELHITRRVAQLQDRVRLVREAMGEERLGRFEFGEAEGLVFIKNGVIERYLGGVYHYEIRKVKPGDFYLIRKKHKVFFVSPIEKDVLYINQLFRLNQSPFLNTFPAGITGTKIRFVSLPLEEKHVEKGLTGLTRGEDRVYYYQTMLPGTNRQILYDLEVSQSNFREFTVHQRRVTILIYSGSLLLVLLICLWLVYLRENEYRVRAVRGLTVVGLLVGIILYFLLGFIDRETLFFQITDVKVRSIYQLLLLVLFLFLSVHLLLKRIPAGSGSSIWAFLLSVVLLDPVLRKIFQSTLIPIYRFQMVLPYLSLVIIILLCLLIPCQFLRKACRYPAPSPLLVFLSITGLFAAFFVLSLDLRLLILYVLLLLIVPLKGKLLPGSEMVILLPVSVFIFLFFTHFSGMERDDYIEKSLKTVFISQNNYAKFIVRSIVNDIRSSEAGYGDFFSGDRSRELERIWQSSLAAVENVPSGIFILSTKGEIINEYFYQMPYYGKEGITQLPFWCIEDRTVEISNRRITYAVGLTKVIVNSRYIGDIVVQVINSPELILRYQEPDSIFQLNRKIDGSSINYLKFDSLGQVVENPGNVEMRVPSGVGDTWLEFYSGNRGFRGYFFRDKGNTIVVYYPRATVFSLMADTIKLMIFIFLVSFITSLFYRDKSRWKKYFYSFSLRVFAILILLSVFTGGILSIFSVNFTTDLMNRNFKTRLLEKGRIAQNVAFDMLDEDPLFTRRSLYHLSRIMNHAISVYRFNGTLFQQWDASNQKMIINSQIPLFLHSRVVNELQSRNEKILLVEGDQEYNLFFRVRGYVFSVPVNTNRTVINSQQNQYLDFVITLLFLLAGLGVTAARVFQRKIMTPINDLNTGMKDVEEGRLQSLEKTPREVELKRLYEGFNSMVEGISLQKEKISEMSRFKTLIKLGRRVAHEVKNPLTPIKLSAEQIEQSIRDKNRGYEKLIRDSVKYIIDETEHLKRVAYGFLNLSKIDRLEKEYFEVSRFIKEQYLKFNLSYSRTHFEYRDRLGERKVYWDPGKIEEILNNFISNAVEAIPAERSGRIRITLDRDNRKNISITIEDNGVGIEAGEIEDIFRENYSSKTLGSGLGLFISRRIVQLHGGHISIESRKNHGTRLRVILPDGIGKNKDGNQGT